MIKVFVCGLVLLGVPAQGLAAQETPSTSVSAHQLVEAALKRLDDSGASKTRFIRYDLVHLMNHDANGKLITESLKLFEDTWINDLQYERLIEKDGKPLNASDLAAENARYEKAVNERRNLDLATRAASEKRTVSFMALKLDKVTGAGYKLTESEREVMDGHSTRVILAMPVAGDPPLAMKPQQRFKLWIADDAEPFIIRCDFEFLADEPGFNRGTRGEEHFQLLDGVPVRTRFDMHGYIPAKKEVITVDVDHVYSRYRRFSTSVTILPAAGSETDKNPSDPR